MSTTADRIEAAALGRLPWYIMLDNASRKAVDDAVGDRLWWLIWRTSNISARTFLLIVAAAMRGDA